jgi:hypothetical protein
MESRNGRVFSENMSKSLSQISSGVGFTETQIEYLPSLLTPQPIQYQSLFISYASQEAI